MRDEMRDERWDERWEMRQTERERERQRQTERRTVLVDGRRRSQPRVPLPGRFYCPLSRDRPVSPASGPLLFSSVTWPSGTRLNRPLQASGRSAQLVAPVTQALCLTIFNPCPFQLFSQYRSYLFIIALFVSVRFFFIILAHGHTNSFSS